MDTAQPAMAAETVDDQISNAADAFKAFTSDQPVRPRDEAGRFTAEEPVEALEAEEADPVGEADPDEGEIEEAEEAAEEAQPMPPSWPADKAEVWNALPAEAKAFVAERDAEQLRATNARFQELANERKAVDAERSEAAAARKEYADSLLALGAILNPAKPDPRAFGAGTGQYNREAYDLAEAQWEEQNALLTQVKDQLAAIQQQSEQEEAAQFKGWLEANNAQHGPKFLADAPELADPVKGGQLIDGLVQYAAENGIDPSELTPERLQHVPYSQMHLIWKAQQFDKLRTDVPQAKPKPASPAVKPGVSSPRSAQRQAQHQRARDRLARDGSIESGAAVWKNFLKG